MSSASRTSTEYGYLSVCKYCGTKPISEGPHHDSTCARHQSTRATGSELALSYECRFCDVRPFVAGPHHAADCRRFFDVEPTGAPPPDAGEDEALQQGGEMTPGTILSAFKSADVPLLTVEEVAERVGCSPEAAYSGLDLLVDRGKLHRKAPGPDSEVFLLAGETSDPA